MYSYLRLNIFLRNTKVTFGITTLMIDVILKIKDTSTFSEKKYNDYYIFFHQEKVTEMKQISAKYCNKKDRN